MIVEFIELYRSEPCLWQVKSEEYHDRTKKDVAYSKLVKKLEELEPGATKKSVVMKINSLHILPQNFVQDERILLYKDDFLRCYNYHEFNRKQRRSPIEARVRYTFVTASINRGKDFSVPS